MVAHLLSPQSDGSGKTAATVDGSTGILGCHLARVPSAGVWGAGRTMLLQWAIQSISNKEELGLTDRKHKETQRLSVSLNKAMRTHRGAHVRKLAEIQKKTVSTPTATTP